MAKFTWGQVINELDIPFNIGNMKVVVYHPWVYVDGASTSKIDENTTLYHNPDMSRSDYALENLAIHWFAWVRLGPNNSALVDGIQRALNLPTT